MDPHAYFCYLDHHDLTELVELERRRRGDGAVVLDLDDPTTDVRRKVHGRRRGSPVVFALRHEQILRPDAEDKLTSLLSEVRSAKRSHEGDTDEREWWVVVSCPIDDTKNVFSNAMVPNAGREIVGKPATASDQIWADAAKDITPDKSLMHASDAAKYVVSNISLVALVLGGFGIFTDLGGGFHRHKVIFPLVVVFAALSLLLAVVALFPWFRTVDYDDLDDIKKAYTGVIKWRAKLTISATIALLVALVFAVTAFFVAGKDPRSPSATISPNWDASGSEQILDVGVDVRDVDPDAVLAVNLKGRSSKTAFTTLGRLTSSEGKSSQAGELKFEQKFIPRAACKTFKVEALEVSDGKSTVIKASTFTRPPSHATAGNQSAKRTGGRTPAKRSSRPAKCSR